MLFPTVEYGLFFLGVFPLAWALRRHLTAHKAFLFAASSVFYAFWDWRFLPLLWGVSALAFAVAKFLEGAHSPRARRRALALGIGLALGVLAAFKYLAFMMMAVVDVLALMRLAPPAVKLPEVALPVGVSFFVFHAISLMVDVYRGDLPVKVRPLDSALYVAFFPQLVAGPILRASVFLPRLERPPNPEAVDSTAAVLRIARGLAKKVLVANFLAVRVVEPVFEAPGSYGALDGLLAIAGYAAQIYCDFSGYSDIAIGSALLLGYRIPENFDRPYLASSPREFWRRWHISLSSWLRDYLFVPLGGSRAGPVRLAVALGLTMLLGGLWHGAAWTFVIWGAAHGAWLMAHRAWRVTAWAQRVESSSLGRAGAVVATVVTVSALWVLFRAPSLEVAKEVFATLGRWQLPTLASPAALLTVVVGLLGQATPQLSQLWFARRFAALPVWAQGVVFALAVMTIEALGPSGVAPFIYFQF